MKLIFEDSLAITQLLKVILPEYEEWPLDLNVTEPAHLTAIEYDPSDGKVKLHARGRMDESVLRLLSRYLKHEVVVEDRSSLVEKALNAWPRIVAAVNGSIPYFTTLAKPKADGDILKIRVPTDFHKSLFQRKVHYIKKVIENIAGGSVELGFEVDERGTAQTDS